MIYYLLTQGRCAENQIRLKNVSSVINKKMLTISQWEDINRHLVFEAICPDYYEFPDVLSNDLFLISQKVRKVVDAAGIFVAYITVYVRYRSIIQTYYVPLFHELDCLHEATEYNRDRSEIVNIVLDKRKVKARPVFRVWHSVQPLVVIRQDVAEELKRCETRGIGLKEVQAKGEADGFYL